MRRRSSSISENLLYPKSTLYLRVAQMILCIVCFILALYFWISGVTLLGATVVLFATSFGFLVVTLVDVLASLKRKQYTAPVWVGLAFLAAFMFFLSFGFMILQSVLLHVIIGVVFAVTGIVFLIDAILIVTFIFQAKVDKRIHPIQEKNESIDQPVQIEDDLPVIEEIPIEMRRIAPTAAAPSRRSPSIKSSPRSSPRSSFKITSYGGTFPMGDSDAPPLPTPDNLTGLEPAIPPQLYVPRRNTIEEVPEIESIPSETSTNKRPSIDEKINLYPSVREGTAPEQRMQFAQSEPGVSQQIQSTTYSSSPTYDQQYLEKPTDEVMTQSLAAQLLNQQPLSTYDRSVMMTPHQAAGEPQPTIIVGNAAYDSRYQREMIPGQVQACQCCSTRAHEPREQITPYVTHHYNQSPCVCGYTHYQASTVVKGAVRQNPQDTLKQQQRMIKEQLEQMRDDHMFQGCSCHDKLKKEKNVPYVHLVSNIDTSRDNFSSTSSHKYHENTEEGSNRTMAVETGSLTESIAESLHRRLMRPEKPPKDDVEDTSMNRKVTIGTMDIMSDYSQSSNSSTYRRWAEQTKTDGLSHQEPVANPEIPEVLPRRSSLKHTNEPLYIYSSPPLGTISESGQGSGEFQRSSIVPDFEPQPKLERKPTVELVSNSITPSLYTRIVSEKEESKFENRFRTPIDSSKETILSTDLEDLIHYGADEPPISGRKSRLGARNVSDSYEIIVRNQSQRSPDDLSTSNTTDGTTSSQQEYTQTPFRRPSADQSTSTKQVEVSFPSPHVEQLNLDDRGRTWSSEAQEAYKMSIASSPISRNIQTVCPRSPMACVCCPKSPLHTEERPMYARRMDHIGGPCIRSRAEDVLLDDMNSRKAHTEPSRNMQFSGEDMSCPRRLHLKDDRHISSGMKNHRENKGLPRMMDVIQEQRRGENIHSSDFDERISHIPPYHDGFPRDVMMIKQMSCICECICNPKIPSTRVRVTPNIQKYHVAPLNQRPYHPKDDFKMPENSFTDFSRTDKSYPSCLDHCHKRNVTPRRFIDEEDHQLQRSPPRIASPNRIPLNCLEQCPDCSSRREDLKKECPEDCISCPIRRRRLEREMRFRGENFQDISSSSKRGSLKRSYPD